jgi:hypothetical protein
MKFKAKKKRTCYSELNEGEGNIYYYK